MHTEQTGPYQGTVIPHNHLAAEIAPFGNPQSGATGPRFSLYSLLILSFQLSNMSV
jgi:hypothetical protein